MPTTSTWHDDHVPRRAILSTEQSEHCGSCSHYNVSIFLSCRPHEQTLGSTSEAMTVLLWIYHSKQSALHSTAYLHNAFSHPSGVTTNPHLSHHFTKALWPHRHHGKYQCFQKERSRETHLVPLSIKATITLMSATYYLILKPYNHD